MDLSFASLVTRVDFVPVCRLVDGAVVAAIARPVGRPGSATEDYLALRRASRMMHQEHEFGLMRERYAAGPLGTAIAARIPLITGMPASGPAAGAPDFGQHCMTIRARRLMEDPSGVLADVDRARAAGYWVVVDEVGLDDDSIVSVHVIEPDIIVTAPELLDVSMSSAARAALMLCSLAALTGAALVVDGVRTEEHRRVAMMFGADYGIGPLYPTIEDAAWLDDRRVALADRVPAPPDGETRSLFQLVSAVEPPREVTRRVLIEISRLLEIHGAADALPSAVLATVVDPKPFGPAVRDRWQRLAGRARLIGITGSALEEFPDLPGRVGQVGPDHPMAQEWNVVILNPFHAITLSGRLRPQVSGPPLFDAVFTFDRRLSAAAARIILRHVE